MTKTAKQASQSKEAKQRAEIARLTQRLERAAKNYDRDSKDITELQAQVADLKAQLERVRSDRPFIIGWNDGFDFGIDLALQHITNETEATQIRAIACTRRKLTA